METPKSATQQIRTMRNHTPRLSERKKKLFDTVKDTEVGDEEDEFLNGIQPLRTRSGSKKQKNIKVMESLIGSCKKSPRVISFFETESEEGDTGEEQKPSPSRRSARLSLKTSPNFSKTEAGFSISSHKENIPIKTPTRKEVQEDKNLQKMFSDSMQITPRIKPSMVIEETSSEDEDMKVSRSSVTVNCVNKRPCETEHSTGLSPARKIAKTSPVVSLSISTKSFYSGKNKTSPNNLPGRSSCRNLFGQSLSLNSSCHLKQRQTPRRSIGTQNPSINRGVHHKVRKRANTLSLSLKSSPVDIDQILKNLRNEKLRKLITAQREEKRQVEKIHSIFRKASNPIAMARPLSSLSNHDDSNNNNLTEDILKQSKSLDIDFSDIESDEEIDAMNEEVIPLITHQVDNSLSLKTTEDSSALVKRKFFKTGRATTTRKEVHLTDNIKATMTANGKFAIVPEKKKLKKIKKMSSTDGNEFSDEQATVDAILRNLDDSAFGEIILPKDEDAVDSQSSNANVNNQFLDEIDHQLSFMNEEESSSLIDDIILQDNQDFYEFRRRLPFNTTDPEIIERQHLLLDFLITNNICTEENFNIFIADPDNHKAEAERIIDELVVVVTDQQNTDFRQRIPYNTTDPVIIEQQHTFLDFLLENNICTEENFDIFIANYNQRKAEAAAILSQYQNNLNEHYVDNTTKITNNYAGNNLLTQENIDLNLSTNKSTHSFEITTNTTTLSKQNLQTPLDAGPAKNASNNVTSNSGDTANLTQLSTQNLSELQEQQQQKLFPVFYPGGCQPLPQPLTTRKQQQRSWNAGYGANQYQIDAGQKAYGAQQCKQCGLLYTVHEPEEEKLHRDFHASLHILRFKGWIDEDIVAIHTEWGPDGRILRLTESSPPKRRERLMDILKIVDKELGFSSYIVPKTFVAYFAVRKMQIVGLCLVQPLNKANKYVCVNGLDCCTEEQFEAKCGISRIWVSPLHRRFHIASKLIQAVQLNTIFGEEVPINKIAFSAPTELGKIFAQKINKTENFLVYQ